MKKQFLFGPRPRLVFVGVASVLVLAVSLPGARSAASEVSAYGNQEKIVWAIGRPDGSSIEFAPGARHRLTYTVGQSVPERDFAGRQDGSISLQTNVPSAEKPYTIAFDLDQPTKGSYHLVLDLIYPTGAPQQIKVQVNQKQGIFPVRPEPKRPIDSNEANSMLLAKQRLVVPIEAAWLKPKGNQITLTPVGLGGLSYDALSLNRTAAAGSTPEKGLRLEPTVFFRKGNGKLKEVCRLLVPFKARFRKGTAVIRVSELRVTKTLANPGYDFGVLEDTVEIPAMAQVAKAIVKVVLDGRSQQVTQNFVVAKQWKVYICPKVHNDVGYTDVQPHISELDTRNTDTVLEILAKYPFYRFNFETAWLVDNYLGSRSPEYRKRLVDWIAKGRATLNAFYLNLLTGLCSGEELYRAMYFTYRLHREQGSNFDFACLTDVPSASWFLPSLLTDVGIEGFSNGSNQTRAPILQFSDLNENSPFYWEGMNGERIMTWYSRTYSQLKRLTSPNHRSPVSSYAYLKTSLPQFLLRYTREDYPIDAVMIYGAYTDNAAMHEMGEAELIQKWNEEYAYPKFIVASDPEYFRYVEKHFGDRLPVYRGDGGSYWEDGAGSTSLATKRNRHTQQTLPAAETTSSFAAIFEPRYRYPAEDFRAVWRNVLFYDEHTWGAFNSTRQPDREFVTRQWEIKEQYATQANLEARNLLMRSLNRLFQQVNVTGDTIFAVNLQNWPRSEALEVEIDSGRYPVDLSNNRPVDVDVILEKDGWSKVRFMAENVPPVGYKGYALRSLDPTDVAGLRKERVPGATIESQYYRLVVDSQTGGVRSLYDKTADRELVDASTLYKLNQYLYVSGGEDSLIIDNIHGRPLPNLNIDSPTSATIIENVKTQLGQRILVEARAKNTPKIRSEYIVYDRLKRVDIVNNLWKEETGQKEGVYFAFPFAARRPGVEYQIQNGWVRPNEDQLPGACKEWFSTQNLVHVEDDGFSILWATPDAPLITLTDINRGKWPRRLEISNGYVFSYVMNNYWFTNYKAAQGGEFSFRYAITSGNGLSREQLARFDADTRSPVLAYPLLSTFAAGVESRGRLFPGDSASLMSLDAPNLQIVVLKAAEDSDGYILRLREIAGRSGEAEAQFPTLRIDEAYLCDGVELPRRKLASTQSTVRIPYKANQYVTLRLRVTGPLFR